MDRLIQAIVDCCYYRAQQLLDVGLYWLLYPFSWVSDTVPEALRELLGPPEDFAVSDETIKWANFLADWTFRASDVNVFLYGSRVRRDHRTTSDLNVYLDLEQVADPGEWQVERKACSEEFKNRFGLELHWLDDTDPIIAVRLKRSLIVHRDRNVFCMWMAPKRKPIFRSEVRKHSRAS